MRGARAERSKAMRKRKLRFLLGLAVLAAAGGWC